MKGKIIITAVLIACLLSALLPLTAVPASAGWAGDDGTELERVSVAYGETPVYSGETPTKAATAEKT